VLADALDQHGHLIGDEAGVGLGIRQHGRASRSFKASSFASGMPSPRSSTSTT